MKYTHTHTRASVKYHLIGVSLINNVIPAWQIPALFVLYFVILQKHCNSSDFKRGCWSCSVSARFIWLNTTILYGTALYYIVLFSTIHYCIVLYCTILYSTVMYCTLSYCFELYYCFDQRWIKRKWTSAWDTWWTYALGIQNQSELCASLPKEEPQGSKVSTFIRQFCQFQKPTTRQHKCIYEDG